MWSTVQADEIALIRDLTWRPDGAMLAVGAEDGLYLLDAHFNIVEFLDSGSVFDVVWSHDGQLLAINTRQGDVCRLEIWQADSRSMLRPVATYEKFWLGDFCDSVHARWSPSDNWLAFYPDNSGISIINIMPTMSRDCLLEMITIFGGILLRTGWLSPRMTRLCRYSM